MIRNWCVTETDDLYAQFTQKEMSWQQIKNISPKTSPVFLCSEPEVKSMSLAFDMQPVNVHMWGDSNAKKEGCWSYFDSALAVWNEHLALCSSSSGQRQLTRGVKLLCFICHDFNLQSFYKSCSPNLSLAAEGHCSVSCSPVLDWSFWWGSGCFFFFWLQWSLAWATTLLSAHWNMSVFMIFVEQTGRGL